MGSPFMSALCGAIAEALDDDSALGSRALGWRGDIHADALPMRVTGGLNAFVRAGKLPQLACAYPPHDPPPHGEFVRLLADAFRSGGEDLAGWLDGPPQTNEVGRSAVLMAGLLCIAAETGLPLRLFEVGASGGLNLRLDAYGYDLGGRRVGPADAPVQLCPLWQGPLPPAPDIRVTERRGVDVAPLDVTDPATRRRLLAYVWPDQRERVERLEAALKGAAANPPPLDSEDAAGWVERYLQPQQGTATVLFHSVAYQYFPAATQARIRRHMESAGRTASDTAPLAWLSYESEEVGEPMNLDLTLWPGGSRRRLAHAHPHGSSIGWLADRN